MIAPGHGQPFVILGEYLRGGTSSTGKRTDVQWLAGLALRPEQQDQFISKAQIAARGVVGRYVNPSSVPPSSSSPSIVVPEPKGTTVTVAGPARTVPNFLASTLKSSRFTSPS